MIDAPQYVMEFDAERLNGQRKRILEVMITGRWLTLREISDLAHCPEASASAQLRHLRNRTGGYTGPAYDVRRRPRGERSRGLWEYQLTRKQDTLPWT